MRFFLILFFLRIAGEFSAMSAQCVPKAIKAYDDVTNTIEHAAEFGKKGEYDKQLDLCLKAVEQTERIQDKYDCFWPNAHLALSDVYYNKGELDKALSAAAASLDFCKKFQMDNCDCMSKSQMKIAAAYEEQDRDSLAKNTYLDALALCELDGSGFKEAFLLLGLGDLARNAGNYEDALSKYSRAENIVAHVNSVEDQSQRILARCNYSRGYVLFQQGECEQAKDKLRLALSEAETAHDQKTIAKCNFLIGKILHSESEFNGSLEYYSKAISIAGRMKYKVILVDACNGKGDIFTIRGSGDSAAYYTTKSYKTSKEVNYKIGMCNALNIDSRNDIELFKVDSLEHVDGLFQAQTAVAYAEQENFQIGIVDGYNNYATYFMKVKNYPEARKYSKVALNLSQKIGYSAGEANALNSLGDVCYKLEYNKDSAVFYYELALEKASFGYFKNCGRYKVGEVNSHNRIGDILKKKGRKTLAGDEYTIAYVISEEIIYKEGIDKAGRVLKLKKSGIPAIDPKNKEKTRID